VFRIPKQQQIFILFAMSKPAVDPTRCAIQLLCPALYTEVKRLLRELDH